MSKKKDDLSVRIMRATIADNAQDTIKLLEGASDAELGKLVQGFIEFTRMLAVYATKRGIKVEGASITPIAVEARQGDN